MRVGGIGGVGMMFVASTEGNVMGSLFGQLGLRSKVWEVRAVKPVLPPLFRTREEVRAGEHN